MEIVGENGWRTELREGPKVLGRGLGFTTTDRTVSRRHVSFELHEDPKRGVRFEVIGKNPIWVLSSESGEIRVFRRHQGGEMETRDSFCFSSGNPIWFSLKRIGFPEMGRCGIDSLNDSDMDPVKEFGFIVMGHEFELYPKRMVRDIKTWNWFLEEPRRDSEEDDDDDDEVCRKKEQRSRRGKRKQAEEGNCCDDEEEDDEWMGEGDEGKELVTKFRTNQRPKYSTRSKDKRKKIRRSKNPTNQASRDDNEYETEDEDTLGGFIVNDGEEENEEEEGEGEEDYDEDVEEMEE